MSAFDINPDHAMTAASDARLRAILRTSLGLPADGEIARLRQSDIPEWDSLAHALLMLAIEGEFGVTIDVADQITLTSYESLRDYLEHAVI